MRGKVKRFFNGYFVFSLFITLIVPFLTVRFAGVSGMAICFLLFYLVNPLLSLAGGFLAGFQPARFGFLPLCHAALFLLGAWLFFEPGEPDFLLYTLAYIGIGYVTALFEKVFLSLKHKRD